MGLRTAISLLLALVSTILTNLAYSRQHDAAAKLPALSMRRPAQSLRLLLADRSWMSGFMLECSGFALYALALGLGSLALVQSVAAGGIGVLAFVSARAAHRALRGVELAGVVVSVLGLLALGVSLAGGSIQGREGSIAVLLVWLGATASLAGLLVWIGPRMLGKAIANGIAGGLMFSIGDISTKLVTQGGVRVGFLVTLVVGYTLGTALLQAGYQAGAALTVAGVATLLTNALPIAAGMAVFGESAPAGALGVLRVFAFVAVIVGAVLLSRPQPSRARGSGQVGEATVGEPAGA
ncbi:MAG TPA: hypothetical protein VMB51_12510 [Solirubrobacteraceae bacterium]|nr:hypothetical protein [Solirubrobacteraceae bacterium]